MEHCLTCRCLAGIMGAKQTSQLIPLCHNISLTQVDVWLELHDQDPVVLIRGDAHTIGRTGTPPSLQTTFLLKHGIQADGDCYHWSRRLCSEVSDRGRFARWIEVVCKFSSGLCQMQISQADCQAGYFASVRACQVSMIAMQ